MESGGLEKEATLPTSIYIFVSHEYMHAMGGLAQNWFATSWWAGNDLLLRDEQIEWTDDLQDV